MHPQDHVYVSGEEVGKNCREVLGKVPQSDKAGVLFLLYTARYLLELSIGRACKYRPVVATEECPSVACTR